MPLGHDGGGVESRVIAVLWLQVLGFSTQMRRKAGMVRRSAAYGSWS